MPHFKHPRHPQVALLFVLFLAACATGAGVPAPSLPQSVSAMDFYPLLKGWGWAYDVEKDSQTVLALYSVLENDGKTATLLNAGEQMQYQVSQEGIARTQGNLPGDFLLKNPVTLGQRWSVTGGEAVITKTGETVTLPSGTYFRCLTVEEHRQSPARIIRTTYAEGVGPVEMEMKIQDPGTQEYWVTVRARLRSVTKPEVERTGNNPR